jgi:cytidine deaminase
LSVSDERAWPEVERRSGHDRRSGDERRDEGGWRPVALDHDPGDGERRLFDAALAARGHAQAPFSRFAVGAALETADGAIVSGCNIENASYGLTVCAERVALLKALSEGYTTFRRILVVADTPSPTPPCGACRQLLWEYCGDVPVVLANLTGPRARHQLADLLPHPFDKRLLR